MQTGYRPKTNDRMANSVDPDEMAHSEPSHLDLHCLFCLFSSGKEAYMILTSLNPSFLLLLKNIDCAYTLETPRRGDFNVPTTIYVLSRNMKKSDFFVLFFVVVF